MSEERKEACDRVTDELVQRAFGELPLYRRRKLAKHMRQCPHCRAEYQDLSSLARGLAALPREHAPLALLEQVRGRSLASPIQRRGTIRVWATAVVAVLLVSLALFRFTGRQAPAAYSAEEIARARAQVQMAMGIWGKAMADTRTIIDQQKPSGSLNRSVHRSLALALKPFTTGE